MSQWNGKTVLVTGGSGFLGSHIIRSLADKGANVISVFRNQLLHDGRATQADSNTQWVQMDLLNATDLTLLCMRTKPSIEIVIHCAALDGNVAFKQNHPAEIITNNVRLASNVLEAARVGDIKDVVMVSSAEIYSVEAENPVSESDDFTKLFNYPTNGYALSKVMIEMMSHVYAEQFGLKIYLPRLTNMYGPGDISGAERGRVIPTMLRRIYLGEQVDIWGDGKQLRTFIHVEDAARAILLMLEGGHEGPLNIATAEGITIEALATRLFDLVGMAPRISFSRSMPVGHRDRVLGVESLYAILNFQPRGLSQGLSETVEWYSQSNV